MDVDDKSQRAPLTDDHEGPIWGPHNMYGHGAARAERVRPNVFWGESKSGRAHSLGLAPDDGDDIQSAGQEETLSGRIVADWCGGVASMFLQAEEDVDTRSNWAG